MIDIGPLPDSLMARLPYLSNTGQVICPRCADTHMVRRSCQAGDLKAQWKCGNGHYSMLPADLRVEWRVYAVQQETPSRCDSGAT